MSMTAPDDEMAEILALVRQARQNGTLGNCLAAMRSSAHHSGGAAAAAAASAGAGAGVGVGVGAGAGVGAVHRARSPSPMIVEGPVEGSAASASGGSGSDGAMLQLRSALNGPFIQNQHVSSAVADLEV